MVYKGVEKRLILCWLQADMFSLNGSMLICGWKALFLYVTKDVSERGERERERGGGRE